MDCKRCKKINTETQLADTQEVVEKRKYQITHLVNRNPHRTEPKVSLLGHKK